MDTRAQSPARNPADSSATSITISQGTRMRASASTFSSTIEPNRSVRLFRKDQNVEDKMPNSAQRERGRRRGELRAVSFVGSQKLHMFQAKLPPARRGRVTELPVPERGLLRMRVHRASDRMHENRATDTNAMDFK